MKHYWLNRLILFGVAFFGLNSAIQATEPTRILIQWKNQGFSAQAPRGAEFARYRSAYIPLTHTQIFSVSSNQNPNQVLEALRLNPQVEHAEIDSPIHVNATPNDPRYSQQWEFEGTGVNIGIEEAWDHLTQSEIIVAIIDSGADLNHEDLSENLWTNPDEIPGNGQDDDHNGYVDDLHGYNFFNHASAPQDDYGHGSQVTGVIGAVGNNARGITGTAWRSRLMILKVLDSEGNSNVSQAVEAIQYAMEKRAKIINMSWGYSPEGGAPSGILQDAINAAEAAGILVVASAGNHSPGLSNDTDPRQANYPSSYPAPNIIAVAATDTRDTLANFSDYGPNTVDIGAPGVDIFSTLPGNRYGFFTGSSAAAPHVTGAAALLWALNPNLRYDQIKQLLLQSVDPIPSLQGKILSGGRVNLISAMKGSPALGGHVLDNPPLLPQSDPEIPSEGGCSLSLNSSHSTFSGSLVFLSLVFLEVWKRNRFKS